MAFPDIYPQTKKTNIYQDMEWGQSFDNDLIGQADILDNEYPSLYTTQLSSIPYFLTGPIYPDDLTQYHNLGFGDLQPETLEAFLNNAYTSEYPTAPPTNAINSSPPNSALTHLHISSPTSSLNPPPSVLPSQKSAPIPKRHAAGSKRSTLEKATKSRSYAYKPLDIAPASWDIFVYTSFGELEPGRTYSTQELVRYLYSNPQHHMGEIYNPELGGLTLWIQRTPQDSSTLDHGHPQAGLCRFEDCEHNNNVIKAGDIRVAFDEHTKYIPNLDPKHNAGYVHLSCLEKKMYLPMLCRDLDIKPEDRVLPLERAQKNPMIMQDRTELDHVQRFITFCKDNGRAPRSYPGLGTLYDEIIRFGPSDLKGIALKQWQQWGAEWDDEDKARKQGAKDLVKAKKVYNARARMAEAAKKQDAKDLVKAKKVYNALARRAEAARKKNKSSRDEEEGEEEGSDERDESESEEECRRPQPKKRSRAVVKFQRANKRRASTPESESDPYSSSEVDSESKEEEDDDDEDDDEEAPTRTRWVDSSCTKELDYSCQALKRTK